MDRLKLTDNEKTRICKVPEGEFDFLGYTFGRMYSARTGQARLGIKMWLECPVEETDDRGRKTRTTEARDNRRGIPQGSPISPLL